MIKHERLPEDILTRIPAVKEVLRQDANVIFAYLFGGIAKGRIRPMSDIDIAVYVHLTDRLPEYKLDLFDRMTEALGTAELDLVILNTAPISLAGRVLHGKELLVDKEPSRRHTYESLTLRKFFDFRVKEDVVLNERFGMGQ
jgi:hypothetical protein